jgi:membrane protein
LGREAAARRLEDTCLTGVLPMTALVLESVNFVLSFGVTTMLFASIYRILPDLDIRWRDVWIGAVATAAMFTLGKSLIGAYLGRAAVTSAYGAAGSLAVLLLWIYYSSLLLFLGAEFTHVYASLRGSQAAESPVGLFRATFA